MEYHGGIYNKFYIFRKLALRDILGNKLAKGRLWARNHSQAMTIIKLKDDVVVTLDVSRRENG